MLNLDPYLIEGFIDSPHLKIVTWLTETQAATTRMVFEEMNQWSGNSLLQTFTLAQLKPTTDPDCIDVTDTRGNHF